MKDVDDSLAQMLEALKAMVDRLDMIYSKLLEVAEMQREIAERLVERSARTSVELGAEAPKALDVLSLLKLPDHLRRTAMALDKLGEGTAGDVAKMTGRERAVESAYLNQLARMGYVGKKRMGRKVVFTVR